MPPRSGRPPRSATEVEATQSRIADVARKLFRDEGFASVSIRRLAREVGCAPMTIYGHFASKTDILRLLWADILRLAFQEVRLNLNKAQTPDDRLQMAAQTFVRYWLTNSDHFRLVFMSNGIGRADVATFMTDPGTLEHFLMISDLVRAASPTGADIQSRADTLVAGLIGIALCLNTIKDYSWSDPDLMIKQLVAAATGPA